MMETEVGEAEDLDVAAAWIIIVEGGDLKAEEEEGGETEGEILDVVEGVEETLVTVAVVEEGVILEAEILILILIIEEGETKEEEAEAAQITWQASAMKEKKNKKQKNLYLPQWTGDWMLVEMDRILHHHHYHLEEEVGETLEAGTAEVGDALPAVAEEGMILNSINQSDNGTMTIKVIIHRTMVAIIMIMQRSSKKNHPIRGVVEGGFIVEAEEDVLLDEDAEGVEAVAFPVIHFIQIKIRMMGVIMDKKMLLLLLLREVHQMLHKRQRQFLNHH